MAVLSERFVFLGCCAVSLPLVFSCTDPGDPIEPSDAYLARQAEYLRYCYDNNGPGQGGIHGQVCRVALGADSFNEDAIDRSLEKINAREDTADFDMNCIVRMLWLDRADPVLPDALRVRMEAAVLGLKYWLTEPGPDTMCWWSENHQILFHAAELLAGRLFPDAVFSNSGMTGREHVAHAEPLILRWLAFRGRFGFSEFHSNVYFNENFPALVNLVDFAEDEEIRVTAETVAYLSPSLGWITVGWEGPFLVGGVEVDLHPGLRWDNPYSRQVFGARVTDIRFGGEKLQLDFNRGLRRYWAANP